MLNIQPRSAGIFHIDLSAMCLSEYGKHPWTLVVYSAYQPIFYALYVYISLLESVTVRVCKGCEKSIQLYADRGCDSRQMIVQ